MALERPGPPGSDGSHPVAQAVEQIGQNKVAVTDVVPAGADPMTYRLSPAQAAGGLTRAPVVVQIGDDFQPTFEARGGGCRVCGRPP